MSFVDRSIPLREINSLIPRITSAINDIDTFKALLVNGHPDGSLPNWFVCTRAQRLILGVGISYYNVIRSCWAV